MPAEAETLLTLETPALVLDRPRMLANIRRLRTRLEGFGTPLRPHLKTAKSVGVARLLMDAIGGPCTVSTLQEAEGFAAAGVTDILYAVGVSPAKLDRVARLRAQGVDLSITLDSLDQAVAVAAAARRHGDAIPVLIEVDTDGRRAGVPPTDAGQLAAIGRILVDGGAMLRGVMAHAGSSYDCRSPAALAAVAEQERAGAVAARDALIAAGLPCPVVSVGSTPTALFAKTLAGVTEVRAGVFVFFDLVMAGIGVCHVDDIALSVLTTVIGSRPAQGRLFVDAGWMALSRDRGTAHQPVDQGYGLVCDLAGRPIPELIVASVNQEHGIVERRGGGPLPPLPVGTRLRILPNHACATAAQHQRYAVVDGPATEVRETWARLQGW